MVEHFISNDAYADIAIYLLCISFGVFLSYLYAVVRHSGLRSNVDRMQRITVKIPVLHEFRQIDDHDITVDQGAFMSHTCTLLDITSYPLNYGGETIACIETCDECVEDSATFTVAVMPTKNRKKVLKGLMSGELKIRIKPRVSYKSLGRYVTGARSFYVVKDDQGVGHG